jgi:hypothetical protein
MGVKPVAIHIGPEVAKRIEMEGYTMFGKGEEDEQLLGLKLFIDEELGKRFVIETSTDKEW